MTLWMLTLIFWRWKKSLYIKIIFTNIWENSSKALKNVNFYLPNNEKFSFSLPTLTLSKKYFVGNHQTIYVMNYFRRIIYLYLFRNIFENRWRKQILHVIWTLTNCISQIGMIFFFCFYDYSPFQNEYIKINFVWTISKVFGMRLVF